jgi:hypothetical protein
VQSIGCTPNSLVQHHRFASRERHEFGKKHSFSDFRFNFAPLIESQQQQQVVQNIHFMGQLTSVNIFNDIPCFRFG